MFNLAYTCHWGYHDLMDMSVGDLELFHDLLEDQWEYEEQKAKEAKATTGKR